MKKYALPLLIPPLAMLLSCSAKNDDKVLARVGGEKITEAQLQEKLGDISPSYREFLDTPAGRRQLLHQTSRWDALVAAVNRVLKPVPGDSGAES